MNGVSQIKVMHSEHEIMQANKRLAARINEDYADCGELLLVGILKGAFIFMSDIARLLEIPCSMDFMSVSSYGDSTVSSGNLKIRSDISCDVRGRDILIVEDILDTGLTLSTLKALLLERGAKSVKICVFAVKCDADGKPLSSGMVDADYAVFHIENEFVVGYGLDYNEKFRNLPFLGIL